MYEHPDSLKYHEDDDEKVLWVICVYLTNKKKSTKCC